ncbi:MFS transporter [Streptomyces sp. NPDC004546]|uniref:MFS transporter n=1 Tax=Streptomyces sp. NPDC004546 TaxID=3154282 RepID=UPI0033B0F5F7
MLHCSCSSSASPSSGSAPPCSCRRSALQPAARRCVHYPGPLASIAFAMNAGPIQRRFGRVVPAVTGTIAMALAAGYWLAAVHTTHDYWSGMFPGLILVGLAGGLAQAPMFAAAGTLAPERATTGSAVLNMSRQIGSAVGVAVLVASHLTPRSSDSTTPGRRYRPARPPLPPYALTARPPNRSGANAIAYGAPPRAPLPGPTRPGPTEWGHYALGAQLQAAIGTQEGLVQTGEPGPPDLCGGGIWPRQLAVFACTGSARKPDLPTPRASLFESAGSILGRPEQP